MGVVAQTVGRVWNCAMAQRGPKNITPEHKAAMAAGRSEGRQIRNYLEALQDSKPKRGRRRTVESVTTRLSAIEDELTNADPMRRLSLVQERIDLSQELQRLEAPEVDMTALEEQFVGSAKAYGERKGISWTAWREVGVPSSVLSRAGISRGS